jgi:hypothetical protein
MYVLYKPFEGTYAYIALLQSFDGLPPNEYIANFPRIPLWRINDIWG